MQHDENNNDNNTSSSPTVPKKKEEKKLEDLTKEELIEKLEETLTTADKMAELLLEATLRLANKDEENQKLSKVLLEKDTVISNLSIALKNRN